MRAILPVALLLALAGSAHAQQSPQNITGGDAAVEARLAPVQTPAPAVQQTTTDVKPIHTSDRQEVDNVRSVVADEAVVRQDPSTRQWWWLVGAIVVAGVILAVLR
jgi:hypothetical protein